VKITFLAAILSTAFMTVFMSLTYAQNPLASGQQSVSALAGNCFSNDFRSRPCTDLDGLTTVPKDASQAFQKGEYQKLDQWFITFCTGNNRMKDGTWLIKHFESGLATHFATWSYSKSLYTDILKWQQIATLSAAPYWAESLYWYGAAWSLPRPRLAEKRSSLNKKLFEQRLVAAETAINRAKEIPAECPLLEVQELAIKIDRGTSVASAQILFDKARRRFPEYHSLYSVMARVYFSRSIGDPIARDAFAKRSAQLTQDFEGKGMYARLYSRKHLRSDTGPEQWIGDLSPSWKQLKESFDDLLTRYPNSKIIVADYLDQACRSDDHETYRRLRASVIGLEAHSLTDNSLDVCDEKHKWKNLR